MRGFGYTRRTLPSSPRPQHSETLLSYCLRLSSRFHGSLRELRRALKISSAVSFEDLEHADNDLLPERLALVTGRPHETFRRMRIPHRLALPLFYRNAFCPNCWIEGRREEAAYFRKEWCAPWHVLCAHHLGAGPLQDCKFEDPHVWPEFATRRTEWPSLSAVPAWWQDCRETLELERDDWQAFCKWLWNVQQCSEAAFSSFGASPHLRVVNDLAVFWQIRWKANDSLFGARSFGRGCRAVSYEHERCAFRCLSGTITQRVQTLAVVYRTISLFNCPEQYSPLFIEQLMVGGIVNLTAYAWLRRRILLWPTEFRERAIQRFRLDSYRYDFAVNTACRMCRGTYTHRPMCAAEPWPNSLLHDAKSLLDVF